MGSARNLSLDHQQSKDFSQEKHGSSGQERTPSLESREFSEIRLERDDSAQKSPDEDFINIGSKSIFKKKSDPFRK